MSWDGMKSTCSFVLGIILFCLGFIPLLQQFNLIGWGLPAFLSGLMPSIFAYLFAVSGIYLLVDSFEEWGEWYFWPTAIVGLIALTAGIIVILNSFGVIGFTVPYMTVTVYNIVFVLEGILLIMGAFLQL
ncbi:MAG: hypothetical protein ACE5FT_04620 [Candidatus Nanoarchaeia archaeon]